MTSGYDSFLDDLYGDGEEKKPKPAEETPDAPKIDPPSREVKKIARAPYKEKPPARIQFDASSIEQLEIPVEPSALPRQVEHKTQEVINYSEFVGYKLTEESHRAAWVSVYEKSQKARSQTPTVMKIRAGEFVIEKGNVEVLSSLQARLGPVPAGEFFNHKWV